MPLETDAPNPPSYLLMPPTTSIFHRIDSQTNQKLPLEGDRPGESTPGMLTLRELAAQINREHERCQQSVAIGLLHACTAGQLLIQAKYRVPLQKWHVWLAAHCNVPEATAQTYMEMAWGWPSVKQEPAIARQRQTVDLEEGTQETAESPTGTEVREDGLEPPLVVNAQLMSETAQRVTFVSLLQRPKAEPRSRILRTEPRKSKPSEVQKETQPEDLNIPRTLTLWIPGSVTPKARPRVTANGTYLPKRYREWRLRAEGEIIMQVHQMNPLPQLPIERAAVRIILRGKHRGDGDNAIGSVCDALVSAGIFTADSLKQIPFGSWRHIPDGETGVKIQIESMAQLISA
ncbi:RusA family crossover junction endodeoxyribonuclease [Phormidium pseudopriestleyi FRX01]|uniref:RusA family crossover junction endodeoxyribonuclease n=1 Tax=Phormidium pseudopriestleyi FRX01 TaxID=1759528 RepID=A0ABS3FTW8_9CYAN|nr:RusA family crossover junction endodeoxyribonuclease [Phormidium pseudopriestleyi]MBO0349782.1 RusA family crossover junction endodeoxyribonuclease [Phormidium pseudopriestleyi FRX01]